MLPTRIKDKKQLFGKEPTGAGGSIEISVGEGTWGDGGSIEISAGTTTAAKSSTAYNGVGMIDATGGSIQIKSGESKQTSSGAISIATADSDLVGVSGELSLNTGSASHGNAGYIVSSCGSVQVWCVITHTSLCMSTQCTFCVNHLLHTMKESKHWQV